MCDNWRKSAFKKMNCEGMLEYSGDGDVEVTGKVNSNTSNPKIIFWAANPPTYTTSYSGAGLPYHSADQAFDKTPNIGMVQAQNGEFKFRLKFPNSYYSGLGTVYMQPHVYIKVCEDGGSNKVESIKLGDGIPFRMLTYPPPPSSAPRCSSIFYSGRNKLPVRTQEQILRDSSYPCINKMPDNFWGLAVPQ